MPLSKRWPIVNRCILLSCLVLALALALAFVFACVLSCLVLCLVPVFWSLLCLDLSCPSSCIFSFAFSLFSFVFVLSCVLSSLSFILIPQTSLYLLYSLQLRQLKVEVEAPFPKKVCNTKTLSLSLFPFSMWCWIKLMLPPCNYALQGAFDLTSQSRAEKAAERLNGLLSLQDKRKQHITLPDKTRQDYLKFPSRLNEN